MTTAAIIVLILRLVVPLSIFKWRISGALASLVLDGIDVILVDAIARVTGEEPGFSTYYQTFDKTTDLYYLAIEAYVSLSWQDLLARKTSIGLFIFRLVGIVIFEATGAQYRKLVFAFPNLFENFFLYYIITARFKPAWIPRTKRSMALVLALLYIPKFGQEYLLHFSEAQPWNWFKGTVLGIK
jgi:hypothetical protein